MEVSPKPLTLIYLMTFLDLFAVGLIYPVLGTYIKELGCSQFQVGVLTSTYAALQVISGPIIGGWSDVRGRKPIYLITLSVSCVCYFLMGFSTNVSTLFLFRLILGIFKHTQTLNKATIADLTKCDSSLNSAIAGKCTSFGAMGFVIGPMIGGKLSTMTDGFQHICTLTAFLFVINTGLVYWLPDLTPSPTGNQNSPRKFLSELKTVFKDLKQVDWFTHWAAFTLKFLYILSTTVFFTSLPFYIKNMFNYGKLEVGYVISFVSLIGVISGFLMGFITQQFYSEDISAKQRTLHGFLLLPICFLGFSIFHNVYIFILLLFFFGVCNAVLRIVTMQLVINKSSHDDKGSLTGAADSVMALGRFVAPMSAGFISDKYSIETVMMYAGMVTTIGTGISWYLYTSDINSDHEKKE